MNCIFIFIVDACCIKVNVFKCGYKICVRERNVQQNLDILTTVALYYANVVYYVLEMRTSTTIPSRPNNDALEFSSLL